ncbi:RNA polymerase sigma factor SigI [Paenibacillus sacheonensis]|uniref:RNA polymerase sigma factor SigI n=1 Tax=Paenibacillus sacheonensis TaxID=742054 RepID=A0A7X5BYE5_9BACL|nr:RNA polymerase sigma factor SigI [Paenibacillus sacheonensis]MBM7566871.1 RNA polymerase sigma factor [Paenibacillus sacheonensis]NBC71493.1 RNA polymerase sigma factor SigI [Paenibacillus sacheonensis]
MLLVLFKRIFGGKHDTSAVTPDNRIAPEEMIEQIRRGEASRDAFINAYQPYIAKVTSRFCKRYIDPARADEFSIALAAFDEAIGQFSSQAGKSFLGFAETVIRRRLIDYVRKESRHHVTVPYSAFDQEDEEESTVNTIETNEAMHRYSLTLEAEARRLEIGEYDGKLKAFDIAFAELPDISPKHTDSRQLLIAISRRLANDPELYAYLETKQKLPIKELCEITGVSRKTIERNRKYIIALTILHNGDFPYLQQYIKPQDPVQKEKPAVEGVRA